MGEKFIHTEGDEAQEKGERRGPPGSRILSFQIDEIPVNHRDVAFDVFLVNFKGGNGGFKRNYLPDFPKAGILFKDITTLIGDADALRVNRTDNPIAMGLSISLWGSSRVLFLGCARVRTRRGLCTDPQTGEAQKRSLRNTNWNTRD